MLPVNLAQRFQAHYEGDEWQAFVKLNHANRAPFSAFIRLEEGVILSLSPERFILLENQHIQTRPIKGTLPRLEDADADREQARRLANSPKDRAENLMIVDLMRNDIGRVAVPGSVQVPELFVVEPFPAVHHLVSTITARLPESLHATDLLRAAFPGGSITGAPKVRAMEIIDELEPQRRNALVRQHRLSEFLRQYGYQHHHSHTDSHKRTNLLFRWRRHSGGQSGRS